MNTASGSYPKTFPRIVIALIMLQIKWILLHMQSNITTETQIQAAYTSDE